MATQANSVINRDSLGQSLLVKRLLKHIDKKPFIMGVDPGFSGAISIIDIKTKNVVRVIDMPIYNMTRKNRSGGKQKRRQQKHIDVHTLSFEVDIYAKETLLAILEEPHSMPKQGLQSTFRFGHNCGVIHGVLAGHYIPVIPVRPAVWKMAIGAGASKEETVGLAGQIFPNAKQFWKLKKHHDRAEASLLGHYGLKFLGLEK